MRFSHPNDNFPGHLREEGELRSGVHHGPPGVREKEKHATLRRVVLEFELARPIGVTGRGKASLRWEAEGCAIVLLAVIGNPRERSMFGEKIRKLSLKAHVKSPWKGPVA